MRNMLIACALCLAAGLVAGCQRELSTEASHQAGTATHPWELPEWQAAAEEMEATTEPDTTPSSDGQVETPALRGPRFAGQDTLDTDLLPGTWVQVAFVGNEILNLVPVGEMDMLELQPNNQAVIYLVIDRETTRLPGSWSKPAPGQFILAIDDQPEFLFFAEIFARNFLYMWNYDLQIGNWYARIPPEATQQIGANRFDTTRGVLEFNDIVGLSYSGVLHSDNEVDVRGMFFNGVLTMRWEDQKGNLGGFASFIVDPEWNNLNGVWWIDDYEAAPFGGAWTGTRLAAEPGTATLQ